MGTMDTMDKIGNRGKTKIGLTYKVNLERLHEIIRETKEYGEPIENFIKKILGVHDGNYTNYYYPDFFIYNYDDKTREYWLSNGKKVIEGNLSYLQDESIISQPKIKLENKLIAEKFLQKKDISIENLVDSLQHKIKEYRRAVEHLHKK
jgi:hypothetical protein